MILFFARPFANSTVSGWRRGIDGVRGFLRVFFFSCGSTSGDVYQRIVFPIEYYVKAEPWSLLLLLDIHKYRMLDLRGEIRPRAKSEMNPFLPPVPYVFRSGSSELEKEPHIPFAV